jgi:hypothetical protein
MSRPFDTCRSAEHPCRVATAPNHPARVNNQAVAPVVSAVSSRSEPAEYRRRRPRNLSRREGVSGESMGIPLPL